MNIQENTSLRNYNTFGMDVTARYFLEINSETDIRNYLSEKKFTGFSSLVLGGGSNILFTKNFDGIVLRNCIKGLDLVKEDADHYYVKAGAGEVWHQFVLHCIKNNFGGVENLSLIPGTVGAAPIQNIGAYGVEQKEVFHELEAIDVLENKKVVFTNPECSFGYRDSIFKRKAKNKYIITSVTFRLSKRPQYNTSYGAISQEMEKMGVKDVSLSAVSQAVCNIRRSKLPDPSTIGNAGSFFKNPTVSSEKFEEMKKEFPNVVGYPSAPPSSGLAVDGYKLAAGWLIEQCGWKGRSFGNYGVHKDQALVLVNYGGAKGNEIYDLSEKVLQSVKQKFGVVLEREVVIV